MQDRKAKTIPCPVERPHVGHTREELRRGRKEAGRSRLRKEGERKRRGGGRRESKRGGRDGGKE